jgi:hypothetical protein
MKPTADYAETRGSTKNDRKIRDKKITGPGDPKSKIPMSKERPNSEFQKTPSRFGFQILGFMRHSDFDFLAYL